MIITILGNKYSCGCERGLNDFKNTGILNKLNTIVNFSKSYWPLKSVGNDTWVEDTEILGNPAQLKPGNCFLYEGQVIAIDNPDRLILLKSETGSFAINRIYNEVIEPEFKILELYNNIQSIEIEMLPELEQNADNIVSIDFPIGLKNIYLDLFKGARIDYKSSFSTLPIIKINIDTSILLCPECFYITPDIKLLYSKEAVTLDEELAKLALNDIMSWMRFNFDQISDGIKNLIAEKELKIKEKETAELNEKKKSFGIDESSCPDNCFNPKNIFGELELSYDDDEFEWYSKQIEYCKKFDECIQKSKTYVESEKDLYQILIQHPDSEHLTDFWKLGKLVGHADVEDSGDDWPVYSFNANIIDLNSFPWEEMTRDCFCIKSDSASGGYIEFDDPVYEKTHPHCCFYNCDFD